jgi:hypothetical protein
MQKPEESSTQERDASRKEAEEKHQLKRQSFLIPTACIYCENRVWTGLKRSAFQCLKCGGAIHKKCLTIGEGNWGICKPTDITRKPKKSTKESKDTKESKEVGKKVSPRDQTTHSFTLLEAVVNDDYEQVLELLKTANEEVLNARSKHGLSILHFAVQSPNEKILIALLSKKEISVNVTNENLETPLHYFCQKFASPNCEKPFKLFLAKGANVNAPNAHGETPLFKAIFNEHVRLLIIQLLLEHGASVNAANVNGDTALHYAVRLGREDLVQVLLAFGADLNIQGTQRQTPIDIAEENGDVLLHKYLKGVKDMILWLKGIGLLKYKRQFIMSGLTKAKCIEMNGHTLCEKVGIVDEEDRNILRRALRRLQNQEKISPMKKSASIKPIKRTIVVDKSNSMSSGEKYALEVLRSQLTDEQIILAEELEYTRFISKGSSAKVWQGLYRGKPVALKVLRGKMDEQKLEAFKKEFAIVSQINSEYVVKFYGLCLEPKLTLVIEYCSRGSLYDVMNDPTINIGWPLVFKFAIDMAKGLQVLHNHQPKILHRDWKSLNLLVTEDWCIKVCDFGLSRPDTNSNNETLVKLRGTMIYCSPEVYQGSKFNEKSDIYAIGIVLWELVNRCIKGVYERPYSEFPHITYEYQIILQAAKQGLRPTIPPCPEAMARLIAECWAQDPNQRPTADILLQRIQEMQSEYEKDPQRWDITIVPKLPPPPPPLNFAEVLSGSAAKTPTKSADSDSEDNESLYRTPKRLSRAVKVINRQRSATPRPSTSAQTSNLTTQSDPSQPRKQSIRRTFSSDHGQFGRSLLQRPVTPPPSPLSSSHPPSPRPPLPKTPSGRLKLQITLSQESEPDQQQPQYIVYTSQVQSEILLYEPTSNVISNEPAPSSTNGNSIPIATIEQELTILDRRAQSSETGTACVNENNSVLPVFDGQTAVTLPQNEPAIEIKPPISPEEMQSLSNSQRKTETTLLPLPIGVTVDVEKGEEKRQPENVVPPSPLSSTSPHSSSTSPHDAIPSPGMQTPPSPSSNIGEETKNLSDSLEPRRHHSEIISHKKQVSTAQLKQTGKATKSVPLLHQATAVRHEKSETTSHKKVKDKDKDKEKERTKETKKDKSKTKERRQSRKKGSK